jgi:hypothetical protein
MPNTKLGLDFRALAAKTNEAVKLCAEDASLCKNQPKEFIKKNKERFVGDDITFLLDMWDSLDLMEERLKNRQRRSERYFVWE